MNMLKEDNRYRVGQMVRVRLQPISRVWHDGDYYEYYVRNFQDSKMDDRYSMYEICDF